MSILPKLKNIFGISQIYADGHCIPKFKAKGYARVTDQNGNPILKFFDLSDYKLTQIQTSKGLLDTIEVCSPDTPNQQINYAEIMALHLALRIALSLDVKIINIDSVTSNAWSAGRISKSIKDTNKLRICQESVKFRKEFEIGGGKILKISGAENLADFGLHRN